MVEGGRGPSFPVVFFDGEREMNIGDVKINPTLEYKPFQLMLSQKIGISPNQISIYLVDRRKNHKAPFSEDRRRVPITGKVNFALICRQRDCSFLVVLKRSRKSRSRRDRMLHGLEFSDYLPENDFSQQPMPDNWILLRRNHQQAPFHDQITQSELADLNDRLQNFRFQRENYQKAMGKTTNNLNPLGAFDPIQIPNMSAGLPNLDDFYLTPSMMMTTTNKVFCEECANAEKNGSTASFHPCANDAVTATFISRLGPIRRPNKPFA